jgi:hypothetical protein
MEHNFVGEALFQLKKLKKMAEDAFAQVSEEQFFTLIDPEANSLALIAKHISGNMRSRWRDFLTTDGEKPDRNRDSEFEREADDTRETILKRWEEGWSLTFSAIGPLTPKDLDRTVPIRGEPHTVLQAITRQMTHYAGHVGQIVFLAKHLAYPNWRSLSIPRGKSKEFDVARDGSHYRLNPKS